MKEITKENIRKNVCNKYRNAYKAHKRSKKILREIIKKKHGTQNKCTEKEFESSIMKRLLQNNNNHITR